MSVRTLSELIQSLSITLSEFNNLKTDLTQKIVHLDATIYLDITTRLGHFENKLIADLQELKDYEEKVINLGDEETQNVMAQKQSWRLIELIDKFSVFRRD
ncbi:MULTISPECIES: hypothetical protein [unclassified Coleofasciculus]|uniref:hypothetical protein n=1 Tax=Cyanophyceae TaxID=3028117 RepID=UPI00168866E3|nr:MULTISPECIES: hypothetical protein [unclassified Coleofasciculus]MBD1897502.1 hypothetical protein [Coleofasciculus sp. FACHB-129]MBD2539268.1 hypothetical protein [Coleofasciculus sp. FACHB-SPT36]